MINEVKSFFAKRLIQQGVLKGKAALAVLLMVLFLRFGFSDLIYLRPDLAREPDTGRYVPIAERILAHEAYAWNTSYPAELLNSVGYPLFLAGVFLFVGSSPWEVGAVQLLLSGVLILILYFHLSGAVGTFPAFIAVLVLAFDPLTLLFSLTILTEILFAVLLGVASVILIRWANTEKTVSLLAAGFLLGIACLVRPMGQLLIGLWALAIFLFPDVRIGINTQSVIMRMKRVLLFVAPAVILIFPWIVRNGVLWDCPTLSSVDRVTLRDWLAAKVIAEYKAIPLSDALSQVNATDSGVCPKRGSEYVQIILTHPLTYGKLEIAGTIPVLFGTGSDRWLQLVGIDYQLPDLWNPFLTGGMTSVFQILRGELGRYPLGLILMGILIALQILIYAASLLGVMSLRKVRDPATRWGIILITVTTLILLLMPGPDGNERFRVPAQPLLIYLAAYGIALEVLPHFAHLRSQQYTEPAELAESIGR